MKNFISVFSKAVIIAQTVAVVSLSSCSKDEEKKAENKQEKINNLVSDGIEIKPQPSMEQSVEIPREVSTAFPRPEPAPLSEPAPVDQTAPMPEADRGAPLTQTPALRMEARNQAMAEMLRARQPAQPGARPQPIVIPTK